MGRFRFDLIRDSETSHALWEVKVKCDFLCFFSSHTFWYLFAVIYNLSTNSKVSSVKIAKMFSVYLLFLREAALTYEFIF